MTNFIKIVTAIGELITAVVKLLLVITFYILLPLAILIALIYLLFAHPSIFIILLITVFLAWTGYDQDFTYRQR